MTLLPPAASLAAWKNRLVASPWGSAFLRYWWLWAVPALFGGLSAAAYALARPDTWRASQALLVRDQASGAAYDSRQGRFGSLEAMKTAQETILEVARDHGVAERVLRSVGPPAGRSFPQYPDELQVQQFRDAISVNAPNGADFGQTEVIHLSLIDSDRPRAKQLLTALCDELEQSLRRVRDARAASVVAELEQSLALARADLEEVTRHVAAMESQVGSDLAELRILNDSATGDSSLRSGLTQIKAEIRQQESARQANARLREFLVAARNDPGRLVAAPQRLLDSQPSLRRLREGLVDSQLRTAELLGSMSADHPRVRAAREAQREVIADLQEELEVVQRGIEAELEVNDALLASLHLQLARVGERLDQLAGLRAEYSNLASDMHRRGEIVQRIQEELAEARATRGAAAAASMLTRLNGPRLGATPEGIGRATIALGGLVSGLAFGLGLVTLVASPTARQQGRRWSDYLGRGRRATDRAPEPAHGERRAADSSVESPALQPTPAEGAEERRRGDRRRGDRRGT